ncbi:hypothetical protein T492DRAFT_397718 [Pavlovales sp. CCMP2436]|nr:hypothetical protein T492DRAFT_397718 [Pavlovales sp. CCMP2436]
MHVQSHGQFDLWRGSPNEARIIRIESARGKERLGIGSACAAWGCDGRRAGGPYGGRAGAAAGRAAGPRRAERRGLPECRAFTSSIRVEFRQVLEAAKAKLTNAETVVPGKAIALQQGLRRRAPRETARDAPMHRGVVLRPAQQRDDTHFPKCNFTRRSRASPDWTSAGARGDVDARVEVRSNLAYVFVAREAIHANR